MADIIWVPLAFSSAIMLAGIFLLNQYLQIPGYRLVLWSRAAVTIALIPVVLQTGLPDDPVFYAAVLASAVFAAYGDTRIFDLTAKHGGGVVARLLPLMIWVAFFLWLAVHPQTLLEYAERPLWALGVVGALAGCAWFSYRLKSCPVSRAAFAGLAPVIVLYGCNIVLGKIAMDHSSLHSGVFSHLFVQSVAVFILMGAYRLTRRAGQKTQPPSARAALVKGGLLMAFFWTAQMTLKNYAFAFADNPSYVGALNETAPVWVMLFYALTRHREEASVTSGIGIMLSAIILSLLTIQ